MKNIKLQWPKLRKAKKRPRIQLPAIDVCLIVYENALLPTYSKNLVPQQDIELTPIGIAEAARRALPMTKKHTRVALALPNHEFIATTLKLPAIDEANLKNAVSLQLPTLLPGNNEALLLAVQAQRQGESTVALWMPSKKAEEFFQAFNKMGLFLIYIIPRSLLPLTKQDEPFQLWDEDSHALTCYEWSGQALKQWIHAPKSDWEFPDFQQQIEESLQKITAQKEIHKTTRNDWENLPPPGGHVHGYAFVPPSTHLKLNQVKKRWKKIYLGIAVSLIVLMIALGISGVFYYKYQLKQKLEDLRNRTMDASQLREQVLQLEEYIRPIKNFPDLQAVKILRRLNEKIPKDSWVSRFKLERGMVEIEGHSPNTGQLVEILTADPLFTEVGLKRGLDAREDTFSIRFKLAFVDVPSYWEQHFLEESRKRNK